MPVADDAALIGSVVGNADFVGLTYALKEMGEFAKDGWSAVMPEIKLLINGIVRLSLLMTFMVWMFRPASDALSEFFWISIKLNFVLWTMNNFWDIVQAVFDGMVGMGVATAPELSGLATTSVLTDPSRVAGLGMVAVTPLMNHIDSMLGPVDTFLYMTELIFAYGALIAAVATFLIFGLLMFKAQAEFYVMAIPAGFMAPFIAWNKTAFIATPAMAYIVNTGIRLFGTTVVIVMGLSIMLALKWPEEPSMQDSVNLLILSIAIFGAGISVFTKLTGLINGGPTADVGSTLGSLWYAARLGSAAGKEIGEVAAGVRGANGPVPRALTGFVNGVRGGGGGSPAGAPGGAAANANQTGGVRGAFQRGMAGARANVAAGAAAGGGTGSRHHAPAGHQMALAHGGAVPAVSLPAQAAPLRQQSAPGGAGVAQAVSGGGTSPGQPQAIPAASGGLLSGAKQDMRDAQAHCDHMAADPAVGPAVADGLRSIANRDIAIRAAEGVEITDPAKGQAMLGQINRIDGRVQRAIANGRPADVINQKSAADYRDVVMNA